jgi:Na+/H+ antiporter NhaD/arsenite permease-like protein
MITHQNKWEQGTYRSLTAREELRRITKRTRLYIQSYIFATLAISIILVMSFFGGTTMSVFVAITFVTYAMIATEKMNRTLAALGGALSTLIALKLSGLMPDLTNALNLVNWGVILTIVCITVISDIAKNSGVFDFITIKIIKRSRGEPVKLLFYLALLTFALTALLGSVPAFMILCALTIVLTKNLGLNPVPYIMGEIIVSNATSMSTVVASFVNLVVAGYFKTSPTYFLSYTTFLVIGVPFALIALFVSYLYLRWSYREQIAPKGIGRIERQRLRKKVMALDEISMIKDPTFFRNSAVTLVVTLALFALSSFVGVPLYLVALIGAFAFLFMSGIEPVEAFRKVDWSLIFFLMGLFIVLGGLDKTGLLEATGHELGSVSRGSLSVLVAM